MIFIHGLRVECVIFHEKQGRIYAWALCGQKKKEAGGALEFTVFWKKQHRK